jgi:hypothetical protein
VDRLLALGLQEYEDGLCSGCGQPLSECMDPDLLEEWTTLAPHRCGACTALAEASKRAEEQGREHVGALRYVVGMPAGWQDRKARLVASRAERAAAREQGD